MSSPKLLRFVRHALVATTGVASPDRAQLASGFEVLCERLRNQLRPLFGRTAVSALFVRALHLATAEYPWLSDVAPKQDDCSLDASGVTAHPLPPDAIEEGLAGLLAHEIGLLTTFIGEDFVMPLLQEAWGEALPAEWAVRREGHHE